MIKEPFWKMYPEEEKDLSEYSEDFQDKINYFKELVLYNDFVETCEGIVLGHDVSHGFNAMYFGSEEDGEPFIRFIWDDKYWDVFQDESFRHFIKSGNELEIN